MNDNAVRHGIPETNRGLAVIKQSETLFGIADPGAAFSRRAVKVGVRIQSGELHERNCLAGRQLTSDDRAFRLCGYDPDV